MLLVGFAVLSGVSCSQYEYVSPTPGVLEFRLRVKNSRTDFMPFGENNRFRMTLRTLEVIRNDGARLSVYADLNAIRRSDDGDTFNCLDSLARDSVYVLGQVYAPPGTFSGIDITAEHESFVRVTGVLGLVSTIDVVVTQPPPPALNQLPRPGEGLNITVNEARKTVVNVMLDLDSTLIRRTEVFQGDLQFYVSSIQNY